MKQFASAGKDNIRFICLNCHEVEDIPKEVVKMLDGTDLMVSPDAAPQFSCEKCGGEMYPEYYRNELGREFRIEDVQ